MCTFYVHVHVVRACARAYAVRTWREYVRVHVHVHMPVHARVHVACARARACACHLRLCM